MVYIPSLLTDPTKDATGGDIEHPANKTMHDSNPMVVSLDWAKPVIEMETDEGFNFFFDGAGGRNELTFADMVVSYNDVYFYESPSKLLIYGAPIAGKCLDKTLKYVGVPDSSVLYDDSGTNITDDSGAAITV